MRYNRYNRSKPTPRNMTVKYAGSCACCGAEIKAGELAIYYPPGTIAGVTVGKIAHVGGLEGTGQRCYVERCRQMKAEGKASTLYPDVPGDPRRELDAPRPRELSVTERSYAQPDPGFVDLDRAYEDQCADICGR